MTASGGSGIAVRAARTRSVPVARSAGVISAVAQKARAWAAMRSSSVAIHTPQVPLTARAMSQTRRSRLRPAISISGLPGRRADP